MWAHQLTGPGRIDPVETPDLRGGELAPGAVLARFEAGGICGSDLPSFLGVEDLIVGRAHGEPGYPLHELVGEVVESAAGDVPVGRGSSAGPTATKAWRSTSWRRPTTCSSSTARRSRPRARP